MRNTATSSGVPIPRPVTDSPILRLIWCITELDRRKAEAEAKRSAASAVVTASATVRKAATVTNLTNEEASEVQK